LIGYDFGSKTSIIYPVRIPNLIENCLDSNGNVNFYLYLLKPSSQLDYTQGCVPLSSDGNLHWMAYISGVVQDINSQIT